MSGDGTYVNAFGRRVSSTDDTIAEAFGVPLSGGSPVSVAEQAAATAFGRTTSADEALLADLEEAGYTASGARGVLSRLADGFSVDAAVHDAFGSAVQPGRVAQLVYERGAGVLRRHGRLVEGAKAPAPTNSAAVAEARDRLVSAYRTAYPSFPAWGAEKYADSAAEAVQERSIRQGWSERQVVEALDRQGATLRPSVRVRKVGRR